MPVPKWNTYIQVAKTPESKVAGGAFFGFVSLDEISKHAILSWIVEGLEEPFGKARMLTFVGSHPVAAYGLFLVFILAFVYYKAYKHTRAKSTDMPTTPSGIVVDISGAGGRGVGSVGDIGRDLKLGDEVHHHYPPAQAEPQWTTDKKTANGGPIIIIRDGSGTVFGLILANHGDPAFQIRISDISNGSQVARFQEIPQAVKGMEYPAKPTVESLDPLHHTAGSLRDAIAFEPEATEFYVLYRGYRDNEDIRANYSISGSYMGNSAEVKFLGLGDPARRNPLALVFAGIGGRTHCLPVPHGLQNIFVVGVRNNLLASAKPLHNIKASINYLHDGVNQFTDRVRWIENSSPIRNLLAVDMEANEDHCIPVFMENAGPDHPTQLHFPQSALNEEWGTRDLKAGRWEAKILVSADNCEPLKGEIEFTVFKNPGESKWRVGCQGALGLMRLPSGAPKVSR